MKKTTTVILALAVIGLLFVTGCVSGQASYTPPSGPVGGGCGVGAPVDGDENPCADVETVESVSL